MDLKCTLETRTSKKGDPYKVFVIKLTPTYEKLVFPEDADLEIIRLLESFGQLSSNKESLNLENPFNV